MKTTEEIIDYLNKSNQNDYVELNYDNEWSFISQKPIKNFIKYINKSKKIYTVIDYENETWYCDNLKTEANIVVFELKKLTNDHFLNEFESIASSAIGL